MDRPQINYAETGKKIRAFRRALGKSAAEMADEMCIVEMGWYKYEQGKCLPKTYEDLFYLARILGTTVDNIVVFYDDAS